MEAYTRALALFPNHAYIWRNRANEYLKLKDVVNAARDIDEAARLQPYNAYLFLRRGTLATLLGQLDEALTHFNTALGFFPRMNYAHFGMGLTHLRAGRPIEALEAYQHGLAVSEARKDLDDALEDLEQFQAEQPSLAGVMEILELLKNWQPPQK